MILLQFCTADICSPTTTLIFGADLMPILFPNWLFKQKGSFYLKPKNSKWCLMGRGLNSSTLKHNKGISPKRNPILQLLPNHPIDIFPPHRLILQCWEKSPNSAQLQIILVPRETQIPITSALVSSYKSITQVSFNKAKAYKEWTHTKAPPDTMCPFETSLSIH